MRKTLIIIFAIALLGVAGFAAQKSESTPATSHANPTSNSALSASNSNASYKDGSYTGDAADTPYGTVQVEAIISGGKINNVVFIKMPDDQPHSREVTAMSEPQLKQNTLEAQSAIIDFVSGATSTCYGYKESLQKALDQAKLS
jgi:uncharacterized protein with FMN-binding domain